MTLPDANRREAAMFWNGTRRPLGEDFARGWQDEAADDAPRVLFEASDGAEAHAAWMVSRREGYHFAWCPGPRGGFSTTCALTAAGRCPLVDEADAVVSSLDLTDPVCEQIVRGLQARAADTRVVVVAPRGAAEHWTEQLPDCRVVAGPLRSDVLVESLRPPVPAES
jgi:hypothetical protein